MHKNINRPEMQALTLSLAGVVDLDKVLVAAALVRTLGIVADVRTYTKPIALVLV